MIPSFEQIKPTGFSTEEIQLHTSPNFSSEFVNIFKCNHLWLLKLHIQIFSPVHVSVLSLNRGVKEQENVGDAVGGGEWFGEVTSASKRRMNDKKNTQADSQAFLFNTDKKHGCRLLLEEVDDALYYYNKCLESEEIICLDRRMTIEAVDGLHKAQLLDSSCERM
ncbi:unnamed protein product [Lactuca saligna]|uniref:Uncharacterized protein n=1 Tax=Lactuca saligna TaxID=75948 RepID=A0AA36A247_LACSI|nr:unnamed protein product [Lactuca saligna]